VALASEHVSTPKASKKIRSIVPRYRVFRCGCDPGNPLIAAWQFQYLRTGGVENVSSLCFANSGFSTADPVIDLGQHAIQISVGVYPTLMLLKAIHPDN
jgi:hypothetical protein